VAAGTGITFSVFNGGVEKEWEVLLTGGGTGGGTGGTDEIF